MLGLTAWDWLALAAYLVIVTGIGLWTARRIKDTAGDKVIDLVWPVSGKIQAAQLNRAGFARNGLGVTIALSAARC